MLIRSRAALGPVLWQQCVCRNASLAFPQRRTVSTVTLGTAYELHVMSQLPRLLPGQLELRRVGGAGDRGIDLRGWWYLPADDASGHSDKSRRRGQESLIEPESKLGRRRLRVIVQCKATSATGSQKKLGPQVLREVEGVLARNQRYNSTESDEDGTTGELPHHEAEDRQEEALVALICSSSGFSKQTNQQTNALMGPHIILMHLPLPEGWSPECLTAVSTVSAPSAPSTNLRSSSQTKTRQGSIAKALVPAAESPLSVMLTPGLTSRTGPFRGKLQVQWTRSASAGPDGRPTITWAM
ncbi:unnamed protein product [Parajaminaea phylloscopi]